MENLTNQIIAATAAKAEALKIASDLELKVHLAHCARKKAERMAFEEEGSEQATLEFEKQSRRASDLEFDLYMAKSAHGVAWRALHELNVLAGIED